VDVCLRFSNQSLCLCVDSHVPPLTLWSYHPNSIVLITSIMRIVFIYFNIVHVMHDAEFIKPTLHVQKCEQNRYTISYMFQQFLSSIINYVDSLHVIFSILFPLFSEYHVYEYSTMLHIILTASKVFVTNTNVKFVQILFQVA
jgi:hypothetical protein